MFFIDYRAEGAVVHPSSSLLLSSLELSDTHVYEPQMRARLGTAAYLCVLVHPALTGALPGAV